MVQWVFFVRTVRGSLYLITYVKAIENKRIMLHVAGLDRIPRVDI